LNAIDSAITRPGRIDIHVQIPIPDFDSRLELLEKSLENMPNEISHNELLELVNEMEGWSSGQVVDSCREAAMNCIRLQQEYIKKSHFVL
jgi:ATP-dependent 26S proteasome regulatory subunit